jgi:hypothetical protein
MEFCHENSILQSPAMQRLGQFVLDWRAQWADSPPDFERFERELHEQVMAVERELLAEELAGYDVTAEQIEVDGVTLRMKGGARAAHREQPGKHASGPTGQREAGCGTVVLYDAQGERLQTVRYGRMPECRKATLQQQLETEVAGILAIRPDLKRVLLADGAETNWSLLSALDQAGGPPPNPVSRLSTSITRVTT